MSEQTATGYVQYGCGFTVGKGWVNYDNSPSLWLSRLPAGGLLNRRNYQVNLQCDIPCERYLLPAAEYLTFTVSGAGNQASNFPEPWPGVVCPKLEWKVEELGR